MKKAELSINILVIAAIAVIILVIIVFLVLGAADNWRGASACANLGGTCQLGFCDTPAQQIGQQGQHCPGQQICCAIAER